MLNDWIINGDVNKMRIGSVAYFGEMAATLLALSITPEIHCAQ